MDSDKVHVAYLDGLLEKFGFEYDFILVMVGKGART